MVTANEFAKALEDNESCMGEIAAHHVTCEQFNIDPDTGYILLKEISEEKGE